MALTTGWIGKEIQVSRDCSVGVLALLFSWTSLTFVNTTLPDFCIFLGSAALLALVCAICYAPKSVRLNYRAWTILGAFAVLVALYGVVDGEVFKGWYWLIKFAAIIVSYVLLINLRFGVRDFAWVLKSVLLLNLALLLICGNFAPEWIMVLGDGRVGTALTPPGTLWHAGIVLFVYSATQYVLNRERAELPWCALALMLVALDGTRTGFLLVVLGLALIVAVSLLQSDRWRQVLRLGVLAILALLAMTVLPIWFGKLIHVEIGHDIAWERLLDLRHLVGWHGAVIEGASANNAVRLQMIKVGLEAIRAHFFVGAGIEATRYMTAEGSLPVHMTYLQVWGDYGLVGFGLYLAFVLQSVGLAVKASLRYGRCKLRRVGVVSAGFAIGSYVFAGLFHPLSNELYLWFPLIGGMAVLRTQLAAPSEKSVFAA